MLNGSSKTSLFLGLDAMARLSPRKTLATLSLINQPRHLIRSGGSIGAAQSFSTSCRRQEPTNVGNVGFAENDTIIGEQAPEPLTLDGITARRAKAGKLVAPTASYSDSDMFKAPVCFPLTHTVYLKHTI